MHVIVVDDAITARLKIVAILKELGFSQIHAAESGLRALELLGGIEPPGLAFVDWNMPDMNGIELVRALRKQVAYARTRILMVTTETGMAHVVEALEAGADEYVMKPFSKEMLIDKLRLLNIAVPEWQ